MFGKNKDDSKESVGTSLKEVELNHKLEIAELEKEHELELKTKDFELKHFKDEAVQKLEGEINDLKKELAVQKKENEMLDKIVDLNSDIIDIKNLVNKLIEKLPTIDLKSLTVNNG